ncbi:hypothetical protein [Cyclobacterium roseum]|nr:hypothetical protein [Cyclobacterium roseum]
MNKSFVVPVFEIQANERSLSIDLYKEIVYEAVEYDKAEKIIHGK